MTQASNEAKDCENCQWRRKSKTTCGKCPRPDLWEDMVPAYTLLVNSFTQKRVSFGGLIGFDYTAIKATAEIICIDLTPDVFQDFRIFEDEILTIANEAMKKSGNT